MIADLFILLSTLIWLLPSYFSSTFLSELLKSSILQIAIHMPTNIHKKESFLRLFTLYLALDFLSIFFSN